MSYIATTAISSEATPTALWEEYGDVITKMHRNDRNMVLMALATQAYWHGANNPGKYGYMGLADCLAKTVSEEHDWSSCRIEALLDLFDGATVQERASLIQLLALQTLNDEGADVSDS